jgi:hypothetical protein
MLFEEKLREALHDPDQRDIVIRETKLSPMELYDLGAYANEWHEACPFAMFLRLCRLLNLDIEARLKTVAASQASSPEPPNFVAFCREREADHREEVRRALDEAGYLYKAAVEFVQDPLAYSSRTPLDGLSPILDALGVSAVSLIRFIQSHQT